MTKRRKISANRASTGLRHAAPAADLPLRRVHAGGRRASPAPRERRGRRCGRRPSTRCSSSSRATVTPSTKNELLDARLARHLRERRRPDPLHRRGPPGAAGRCAGPALRQDAPEGRLRVRRRGASSRAAPAARRPVPPRGSRAPSRLRHRGPALRQPQRRSGERVLLRRPVRGADQRPDEGAGASRRRPQFVVLVQGARHRRARDRPPARRGIGARGQRAQGRRPAAHLGPAHRHGRRLPRVVRAVRPDAGRRLRPPGRDLAAVLAALKVELVRAARPAVITPSTASMEAYLLYLQGRSFWHRRFAGQLQKAMECFEQAIQKDPGFALAYSGLADSFRSLGVWAFVPPHDAFPRATALARQALDARSRAGGGARVAWRSSTCSTTGTGRRRSANWRARSSSIPGRRSFTSGPAHYLSIVGRFDEALAEVLHAQALDPLSPASTRTSDGRSTWRAGTTAPSTNCRRCSSAFPATRWRCSTWASRWPQPGGPPRRFPSSRRPRQRRAACRGPPSRSDGPLAVSGDAERARACPRRVAGPVADDLRPVVRHRVHPPGPRRR